MISVTSSTKGSFNERVAVFEGGGLNTLAQAGLSFGRSRFMQATMRSTFGISELHSRNTSGVQAWRSSADAARLADDCDTNASAQQTKKADFTAKD
jgi:hypothetical protein